LFPNPIANFKAGYRPIHPVQAAAANHCVGFLKEERQPQIFPGQKFSVSLAHIGFGLFDGRPFSPCPGHPLSEAFPAFENGRIQFRPVPWQRTSNRQPLCFKAVGEFAQNGVDNPPPKELKKSGFSPEVRLFTNELF
jgi:hypothetical protein